MIRSDLEGVRITGQTTIGLHVLGSLHNNEGILHVILAVIVRNIAGYQFFHFKHILAVVVIYLNLLRLVIRQFECLRACTADHVLDFQILSLKCLLFICRLFFHRVRTCRDVFKISAGVIPAAGRECQRRISLGRGKAHEVTCRIKFAIFTETVLNRKVKDRTGRSYRTVHTLCDCDIPFFRRGIILSVLVIDCDRLVSTGCNARRTIRSDIGISYAGIVSSGSFGCVLFDDGVLTGRNIVEDISARGNICIGKCLCVSERTQDRKLQVVQICELCRVNCSGTILVIVIDKRERLVDGELTLLYVILVDDIYLLAVLVQRNVFRSLIRV